MSEKPEAIQLELFTNRFSAIATDMGEMLQRTAISTNIKERFDFSCALLSPQGKLVANAPHIPVHLGALGLCVRSVMKAMPMEEGDVIVTNHPAFGGAHLPDVSVITPVFFKGSLLGFVANRAHHSEIGGTRPGSMPPEAASLMEEGVIIRPTYLVKAGVPRLDDIKKLLSDAPYPSRSIRENIADLNAALAANHRGALALHALASQYKPEVVLHFMELLDQYSEKLTRKALDCLERGVYKAEEYFDDGHCLKVKITVTEKSACFDFTGTSLRHPGNLNAPPAITRSVIIYILRLLLDENVPLNEGIMNTVDLKLPTCMINPDFDLPDSELPAIVGGNVETSQRLVGLLIKALGLAACSQGTMNNILFGNDHFGYYETVCGGSGAGPGFNGADAVHTHMTNTRITDPEIFEHRYPTRLEKFAIRKGSGGNGKFKGGDGVVREMTFLEPMDLCIVSQHRNKGPFGMAGGENGKAGSQHIIALDNKIKKLDSIDGCRIKPGERFILKTPGGGGYGPPAKAPSCI